MRALTFFSFRIALLLAVGVATSTSQTASPVRAGERVSANDSWYGTLTARLEGGGLIEVLTGTVIYEYSYTLGPEDYYVLTGGTMTWSASGGSGDCIYTGGPTVIPLSVGNTEGEMLVRADGRYTVNTYLPSSPGVVTVTCPEGSSQFAAVGQGLFVARFVSPYFYLSDSGRKMVGTDTLGATRWTWDLTSDLPGLEVELDDYDTWRPGAGKDEKDPGRDLIVHARVLKPDGTLSTVPADSFRYELIECSKVPGIAMNFPLPAAAKDDRDLQFIAARNPDASEIGPEGQWMTKGFAVESQATLTAFDWGAFAKLKVTALVNGVTITGHLKGDPAMEVILIPKRDPSSYIADGWKSKNNATSLADDDDTDSKPEGDGDVGDGLTLYEEYRGFIENGKHLPTKPGKKDLFIRDELGGRTKQGIGLFISATKLAVHHQLRDVEFPANRVINANNAGVPHAVDQHALKITLGAREWVSSANGGPGLPRKITNVDIATGIINAPAQLVAMRSGGGTANIQLNTDVVAHEIGHCVNIWHHGEIDQKVTWELKRDGAGSVVRDASGLGVILENGATEVTLQLEGGTRVILSALQPVGARPEVWVGYRQGQHSGQENCFMRYKVALVYATSATTRYIPQGSSASASLPAPNLFCSTKTGTGVNSSSRNPRPQFGDAAGAAGVGPAVRGSCLKRLCVNDIQPDH